MENRLKRDTELALLPLKQKLDDPIHVTRAALMPKSLLAHYVFGKDYMKHILLDFDTEFLNTKRLVGKVREDIPFTNPIPYVYDSNKDCVINLMNEGIKRNLIYKYKKYVS
jgi:hypothetical protein